MALGHFNAYELLAHARYCAKCGNTEVLQHGRWWWQRIEKRRREGVIQGEQCLFSPVGQYLYHFTFHFTQELFFLKLPNNLMMLFLKKE